MPGAAQHPMHRPHAGRVRLVGDNRFQGFNYLDCPEIVGITQRLANSRIDFVPAHGFSSLDSI